MPGPLPAQQDAPFFSLNLPLPLYFSFDLLPDTFARSSRLVFLLLLHLLLSALSSRLHPQRIDVHCSVVCRWLRDLVFHIYILICILQAGYALEVAGLTSFVLFPDTSTVGMHWIRLPTATAYLPPTWSLYFLSRCDSELSKSARNHPETTGTHMHGDACGFAGMRIW